MSNWQSNFEVKRLRSKMWGRGAEGETAAYCISQLGCTVFTCLLTFIESTEFCSKLYAACELSLKIKTTLMNKKSKQIDRWRHVTIVKSLCWRVTNNSILYLMTTVSLSTVSALFVPAVIFYFHGFICVFYVRINKQMIMMMMMIYTT